MLKTLATVLVASFLTATAHASETDCTTVKLMAADTLSQACASEEALSPEQIAGMEELSSNLTEVCGDNRVSETLERGMFYKKLDLNESCSAKADLLAKSGN
ncbi:MAG: hypothetical protein ACXVA9_01665 [Bdellovibrionales bacterium]